MFDGRRFEKLCADWERAAEIERLVLGDRDLFERARADSTHLPNVKGASVKMFYGNRLTVASATTGWQSFKQPKNWSMVFMLCIGGGASGGGGLTGASLAARGGGGGGGSGALARALYPAFFLPKQLFILPGAGGRGVAAGTLGISGGKSVVSDSPNSFAAGSVMLVSGSTAAAGGVAGTSAGAQAGGAAETIATNILGAYMGLTAGLVFIAGVAGSAAGALGANGSAVAYGAAGVPVTGGSGGGSTNTSNTTGNGGQITAGGLIPTIAGGAGGVAGTNGQSGYQLDKPWISLGGCGGGSGSTSIGGNGGNGSWGSGSGGGGGGTTGGSSGDAGGGLVLIAGW